MTDTDKRLHIRVDEKLHERIKERAEKENRSISEFVLRAVEKDLESEKEKKMTETRKVKNYEVDVNIEKNTAEHIVEVKRNGERLAVYPYQQQGDVMVKMDKVNFNTLRAGIYSGRIELY